MDPPQKEIKAWRKLQREEASVLPPCPVLDCPLCHKHKNNMFTEPNGLPSRGKNIKILLIATRIARRRKEMAALLMMDLASKWIST